MAADVDEFSTGDWIASIAQRGFRLRLGAVLHGSVPLEMAVVTPIWLLVYPLRPDVPWTFLAFHVAALAACGAALTYVRRIGSRPLEVGWRLILFAQLLGILQAAMPMGGLDVGGKVVSALWAVGGLGVFAGLRLDWFRRASDIERLRLAIAERHAAHHRFVELVDTVDGVVWEASVNPFQFQFVSRRAGPLLGFAPAIWIQQSNLWSERIHPEDRDNVLRQLAESGSTMQGYQLEYRMLAADGRTVWVRDLVNVVRDPAGEPKLRGVTVDVTETKQLEQRLRHGANHDPLTGLPNRAAFTERLERVFRHSGPGSLSAVVFLDLDHFKVINDTLGHWAGDAVLEETAARIVRAVRSRDVVARLGGDEFAVLAERLGSADEAVDLAGRLRRELNRPVQVGGQTFALSASVGVKLVTPGSGSPKEILRDADTAMYAAKANARGSQQVFESAMHDRAPDGAQERSARETGPIFLNRA